MSLNRKGHYENKLLSKKEPDVVEALQVTWNRESHFGFEISDLISSSTPLIVIIRFPRY